MRNTAGFNKQPHAVFALDERGELNENKLDRVVSTNVIDANCALHFIRATLACEVDAHFESRQRRQKHESRKQIFQMKRGCHKPVVEPTYEVFERLFKRLECVYHMSVLVSECVSELVHLYYCPVQALTLPRSIRLLLLLGNWQL